MGRKAVVFGSSGLVGKRLLQQLVEHEVYSEIVLFNRSKQAFVHFKVKEVIIDFKQLDKYKELINADVLFCTIGTTIKKAGSKKAFYSIDHDITVQLSAISKANNVGKFIVISSLRANAASSNFYLRTKGQTEEHVLKNLPNNSFFLRPSLLLGDRKEFRLGEKLGMIFMKLFGKLFIGPLKEYRGISAKKVAAAMIRIDLGNSMKQFYESGEIIQLTEV